MEASEARLIAERAREIAIEKHKQEAYQILSKIEDEANKGKFDMTIGIYLNAVAQKILKDLGYEVKTGSHRNESYTTISWNLK